MTSPVSSSSVHENEKDHRELTEGVQFNPFAVVNSCFSSTTPKHAVQGVFSAAQNVMTGVGLGVSSLVLFPVVGWKQDGAKGAAKGVAIGAAGLLGMSAYGVGAGLWQAARGLCNTPRAVGEAMRGDMYWDSLRGEWTEVRLATAFAELPARDDDIFARARELFRCSLLSTDSDAEAEKGKTGTTAGGRDYYAILEVPRTATAAEIRRAFHKMTLKTHPDKNPGDKEANRRFQEVLEANNVLSDESRRAYYDLHGTADSSQTQDTSFTQIEEIFGANFMEIFVGRMSYALHFVPDTFFDGALKKEFQRRRALRLAQNLLAFVGDEAGLEAALPRIRDAVSTRIGPKFMPIVAQQYITASRQHLFANSLLREMDSFLRTKWAFIAEMADITVAGIPAAYKAARKTFMEDDALNLVAAICEQDVRKTVLRASRLILYDSSVSLEERNKRAKNLSILGEMINRVCQEIIPK